MVGYSETPRHTDSTGQELHTALTQSSHNRSYSHSSHSSHSGHGTHGTHGTHGHGHGHVSHNRSSSHSNTKHTNFPQLSRKFVARRISEGETGRLKEELKCQACGKGYKHVSSLAKHLWEHTPEWNVTSKLLISKHQQVQLLEAASILVSMNDEDKPSDASDDDKDAMATVDPADFEASIREALNRRDRAKSLKNGDEKESLATAAVSTVNSTANSTANSAANSAANSIASTPITPTPIMPMSVPASVPMPVVPAQDDSAVDVEELTPARDIPILSAKPIAKTPARHSIRRLSTNAGSLGSLGVGSLGRTDRELMFRQVSPLPESILAKDHAHHPPHRRRRQSNMMVTSNYREPSLDLDEDGLQDPQDQSPDNDAPHTPPKDSPSDSPRKNRAGNEDVFGLEV